MAAPGTRSDVGTLEFVYIVFYRLRTLTKEEKEQWFSEWAEIKKQLPQELMCIADTAHAFGTEFTGFTVLEGPLEQFRQFTEIMEKSSAHVVEKTRTIIGTKGPMVPISEFKKILETHPID